MKLPPSDYNAIFSCAMSLSLEKEEIKWRQGWSVVYGKSLW